MSELATSLRRELLLRLARWDLSGRLIGTCPACLAVLLRALAPDLAYETDDEIAQRWDELLDAVATGTDPNPVLDALAGTDPRETR